jgi:hypothetical protein
MKTYFVLYCILILPTASTAASLIVNWSMIPSDGRQLENKLFTPLSAGTAASGDGTLVELGYYSLGSVASPFSGSWNSITSTTIGDDGIEVPGRFSTSTLLSTGPYPFLTESTPLAIRFYDGTSVGNSTFFNAISDTSGAWNFKNPNDPAPVLNLAIDKKISIVFEGSGAFRTMLPIPEPSSMLLASVALLMSIMNRRRHEK